MLIAVARMEIEKPATVEYAVRGFEHKVVALHVLRVIFYYPKTASGFLTGRVADQPIA